MATSDRAARWVRRPPPWGLVDLPSGTVYLVVELFGLVLAINFVYAAVFLVLERKILFGVEIAGRTTSGPAG